MLQYLFIFGAMNYKSVVTFFSVFALVSIVARGHAQSVSQWQDLSDVSFVTKTDPLLGYEVESPVFGKKVKALEGKRVTVKGYIVPLEEMRSHKYFVLSSLPYNICFFCGGAGPETVVEVYSREEIAYRDTAISITGTLELNQDDPLHLMYILKDAVLND